MVFLLMVYGFSVFNMLNPSRDYSETENRTLQQKPTFTVEKLMSGEYTAEYEKYITDQFLMRDDFITVKLIAEIASGKNENKGVYIGDDGYLLQKFENVNESQLEKNIAHIEKYVQNNPNTQVMLVPTSTAVLDDKLPNYAVEYDQIGVLEGFSDRIGADNFVDVYGALQPHNDQYIYYKTDHHWTSLGAYYGYSAWMENKGEIAKAHDEFITENISADFYGTHYSKAPLPTLEADVITKYEVADMQYELEFNMGQSESDSLFSEEFLETKDQYSYFIGGNNPLVKITTSNKNGKKIMVIKDSYGHTLVPLLASEYEEIHVLDLRYLNLRIADYKETNNIDETLIVYNLQGFSSDMNIYMINS